MKFSFIAIALCLAASVQAEPVQGIVIPFKQLSVSSPVLQEIITEVLVEEGTVVKKDQIIVQLRNKRELLDVQLSEKVIQLKRFIALGQEKLFKEKMGSEEKALEAKTDLEASELQKDAKQVALDEKTVRSPIDGVVVKKHKEAGESVDRAEKLVDIMNYDQVFVTFYVKPEYRKSLQNAAKVSVKVLDLDGANFEGKIDFIDPRNEAASGLVRVKVLLENQNHRIKPGMKAAAEFSRQPL